MPRSVKEWIGKTDDTPIPPRVKNRILDHFGGRCCHCGRSIHAKLRPVFDHRIALINHGENKESNIQLLCHECDKPKTRDDMREKSMMYRKRIKRMGFKRKHLIPGSKGSGFRKRMDGTVVKERSSK